MRARLEHCLCTQPPHPSMSPASESRVATAALSFSSSFSSSSPSSDCGSSRPERALLPVPLGSVAARHGPRLLRNENSPEVGRKVSGQRREPRLPPPPPPGAGSGSCPRLAVASQSSAAGRGVVWGWGQGAVSVCLSVSAAGPTRDPEGRAHAALWRSPPKNRSPLCPCPSRVSLVSARSLTRSSSFTWSSCYPLLLCPFPGIRSDFWGE